MKVLIIEDEDLTAEDLWHTLKRIDANVQLETRLSSVKEALAYFKKGSNADLIFSDIQLGDGESFDIFKQYSPKVPIVFCTAFDQYMLEAFQTFSLDYILKPFSESSIRRTLEKYNLLQASFNKRTMELVGFDKTNMKEILSRKTSIIVIHADRIIPVQIADISLCYIELENIFIKTKTGKEYVVNKSLEELEQLLGDEFFRVNRQHILRRQAIAFASMGLSRKLNLNLHVEHATKISVSKEKHNSFLQWLEG